MPTVQSTQKRQPAMPATVQPPSGLRILAQRFLLSPCSLSPAISGSVVHCKVQLTQKASRQSAATGTQLHLRQCTSSTRRASG